MNAKTSKIEYNTNVKRKINATFLFPQKIDE